MFLRFQIGFNIQSLDMVNNDVQGNLDSSNGLLGDDPVSLSEYTPHVSFKGNQEDIP